MTTQARHATAGLDWPLMKNNIARDDLDAVCDLLQQDDPILTQSRNVRAFERGMVATGSASATASLSTPVRPPTC